ncbi:hypothetical protein LOC59_16450 [Arthrobacter sp. zg-Y916]|uniref:hypothetical protein n=1 Tax=Arthrobacter sp. zg-Y916 TaxID=2894190 RepID=UPI001E2E66CC|nr:hypothetical protein [Arthrobacter sp. zg-Y916]MCC9195224.1 hypothetical protein [Arthrobacter sp. zg-Y916]
MFMRVNADVHAITESTLRSLNRIVASDAGNAERAIVAAASLAESLVDQFIALLVAESDIGKIPLGRRLLSKSRDSFNHSWDERNGWLKGGFGVAIAGTNEARRLKTVIEVRNAIIHGDGQLTERQRRNVLGAIDLRREMLDVLASDLQGRRLILSHTSGHKAMYVVAEYALALDHAVAAARAGT